MDQSPDATPSTQLHTIVLILLRAAQRQELLEWQLSYCNATALAEELLPSFFMLGATIGCKESNEHRICSNRRLCPCLLIFPHTERRKNKKNLCLLEEHFFLFSLLTVAGPQCQSSPSPAHNDAHPSYWMYI